VKKLTRLWQTLERVPGFLAIPAFWEAESGEEFDLISPFLRPTDTLRTTHPCPLSSGADCPRKIIDHGAGEIVPYVVIQTRSVQTCGCRLSTLCCMNST